MGNDDSGRRPLDVLDTAKGDRVIAELKGGETVSETYSHSTCI